MTCKSCDVSRSRVVLGLSSFCRARSWYEQRNDAEPLSVTCEGQMLSEASVGTAGDEDQIVEEDPRLAMVMSSEISDRAYRWARPWP